MSARPFPTRRRCCAPKEDLAQPSTHFLPSGLGTPAREERGIAGELCAALPSASSPVTGVGKWSKKPPCSLGCGVEEEERVGALASPPPRQLGAHSYVTISAVSFQRGLARRALYTLARSCDGEGGHKVTRWPAF